MSQILTFQPHFAVPLSYEQRSYQFLKLPNGIVGLILTDPTEDVASCCLSVGTGHHSNPDTFPGLAHLCEHMICLSSQEYSQIDYYRTLVRQAGGSSNALTTNEVTSFFFTIPINASRETQSTFEKVLDVFTSNFTNPNFDSSYSNREIYAVDNEHTFNKSKTNRLAFQGYKLLANKQHQFSRFSTGDFNSLTENLKNCNISSYLQHFFKAEYTPDRMTFVLRGPQSLNYLQKLAVSKFGKIRETKKAPIINLKPAISDKSLVSNTIENIWSKRYSTDAFSSVDIQRAVLINKDSNPLIRIAFPVSLKKCKSLFNKNQIQFYIDFWCDAMGSESANTIASVLFSKNFISSIVTKTSSVTYDILLLELEFHLEDQGAQNISTILDIIFNYVHLFISPDSRFLKHLGKSMSQFNGIGIYNYLYSETNAEPVWEARNLSKLLLTDIGSYGMWFARGSSLYDESLDGFAGAYSENNQAKEWWISEAKNFCKFMGKLSCFENCIVSFVGNVDKINHSWLVDLPESFNNDINFDFDFKIAKIKPDIINQKNMKLYDMNLSPPNTFIDDSIDNQTRLLEMVCQTMSNNLNSSLGYSVKNISLLHAPTLFHYDAGCQLWIKPEIEISFKNKVLFTIELVNTKLEADPSYVTALEILVQLVKFRINEYLYPALAMNYCYDLFPSFKGDTGILLHVSGPSQKFDKVLTVIIYELKLITETFQSCISMKEFQKAKQTVVSKYENAVNISSIETAVLGLMATVEENTWMINQRIDACNNITIENLSKLAPKLFSSCYMTSFLQGDISKFSLETKILPIVTKLVQCFEGESYQFPSSVLLPLGSNYFVHTFTKDDTNCVEYFIQTCPRDDIAQRSITKFVTFIMTTSLVAKIRSEYQLGYIVLVGLRSLRKTQGVHISVVSGGFSASELDYKLDDILVEWYEQIIKKMKTSTFNDLIEKFVGAETSVDKTLSVNSGPASLFFGVLGGGDRKVVKQHNSYWEQIQNKTYSFTSSICGEDEIDLETVKKLDVERLRKFIQNKILPTSKQRSKLSVLVDSKCLKEEVESKFKTIQLLMYLSSMGLPIKKEHLEDILEKSGDSQVLLGKNLYKYYHERGKSITLIAAVIARLSKSLLFSGGHENSIKAANPIPQLRIDDQDLRSWQKSIGYVRDSVSMKQRLAAF